MADLSWTPTSPLQYAATPGRHGGARPGVFLSEGRDFDLVLVFARRGQREAVDAAAKTLFGAAPPTKPQAVTAGATTLIWSGADQFYALAPRQPGRQPLEALTPAFAGKASLSDQSDGRALIRIAGPKARDALAKLSSLDLDDKIFPIGAAAATAIDHSGVNLWREPDTEDKQPAFAILTFTSFANSIWNTIKDASKEFNVEVR